jgi:4-hydroxy-4-methyl-2-oxoglutarate aldolase
MYGHIYHNVLRPDAGMLKAFEGLATATISDAMGRHGAASGDIHRISGPVHIVGCVLTVLCFPGDNLMAHKALQMVQAADVLVIDDGNHDTACFGHNSALHVRSRGGAGTVVAGSVRDVALLRRDNLPVFARSISPRAPQKNTPGSINVPVHIGGIVVCPGDIVVGDEDGIVVVPLAMAGDVIAKAMERDRRDQAAASAPPGELPLDPSGAMLTLDRLLEGKVVEHHEQVHWRPLGSG